MTFLTRSEVSALILGLAEGQPLPDANLCVFVRAEDVGIKLSGEMWVTVERVENESNDGLPIYGRTYSGAPVQTKLDNVIAVRLDD